MPRIRRFKKLAMNVPDLGRMTATWTDDWHTGTTVYGVSAPHVRGSYSIRLWTSWNCEKGIDLYGTEVDIDYGHAPGGATYLRSWELEDRPVIYGVTISGGAVVNTDKMREERLSFREVNCSRVRGRAPEGTSRRNAAVVHALLVHWLTRPENLALRLAACRNAAQSHRAKLASEIKDQRKDIEKAFARLHRLQELDAAAAVLASLETAEPEPELNVSTRPARDRQRRWLTGGRLR